MTDEELGQEILKTIDTCRSPLDMSREVGRCARELLCPEPTETEGELAKRLYEAYIAPAGYDWTRLSSGEQQCWLAVAREARKTPPPKPKPMRWCVRVVQHQSEAWEGIHATIQKLAHSIRAETVSIGHGRVVDLVYEGKESHPSKDWAEGIAEQLRAKGINAAAAPEWVYE